MRVLVVGSGGREHALAWKLKQSPGVSALYCAPGNPGTALVAENIPISATDIPALADFAEKNKIDLTVVGPEVPLELGIADLFSSRGLQIFGPTKAAAQLETSKAFAKEVMLKAGVATARAAVCETFESAKAYVLKVGAPVVIKADGLAAGKGVVVADSIELALSTLEDFMLRSRFGSSSARVVIEEFLVGQEASVIAIVCGETVIPLVMSQDHKRLLDGDQGPNTGGVGAVSPVPVLPESRAGELVQSIFLPTVRELAKRGIPFTGFLYAGVMVAPGGDVSVIEFNCRLGDPETQVLMMRMKSDLLPLLAAAASGKLTVQPIEWRSESAACVVICSEGYPEQVKDGKVISGLFDPEPDLIVFQAGTTMEAGETRSKGGRVLGVTALGATLPTALQRAYSGTKRISFEGMHFRSDIGKHSLTTINNSAPAMEANKR